MLTTDRRILALEMLIVALCLYFLIDAPAYAHDCVGRMQNSRSVADLVAQATVEDCMRTGYIQALIAAIAAAMAGGAISVAVARALTQQPDNWLDDWNLKDPDAFCKLGQRIKQLPGFKTAGTPREQAAYLFDRMQEVASRHNLRVATGGRLDDWRIGFYRGQSGSLVNLVAASAAAGGTLGAVTTRTLLGFGVGVVGGALIGAIGGYLSQPKAGDDREDCASLKFGKLGNCGDFAVAMRAAMQCAGVSASIVAADNSPGKEFSPGHAGTYTTVVVPDPNDASMLQQPEKWKYFDLFMQLTSKDKTWSDIGSETWMNNFPNKKSFIKEYGSHNVKAWRCAGCGTINGWSVGICRSCRAKSPLPSSR